MLNQNRDPNDRNIGVSGLAQGRFNSRHPSQHITPQPDNQDTTHSSLRHGQGSSLGARVSPLSLSQQARPFSRTGGVARGIEITPPDTGLQSDSVGNTVFPNFDFGLSMSSTSQPTHGDGPLSTQGSAHRRNQPSIDMSGIELPFEITGDEYDLPHSPRTYAYLEAIANRIHDPSRNPPRTPASLSSKSAHNTKHSNSQSHRPASGAHPPKSVSASQRTVNSTRETQHATIDPVKSQNVSDRPSNSLPHFDGQYVLPPPATRPGQLHRRLAADVNATPSSSVASSDQSTATNGRNVPKRQMSNLGVSSSMQVLTASEVLERDHVLRDLQDQLIAARAEIEELKIADRKREPSLALQQPGRSTYHNTGSSAEQSFQLSQSVSHFAAKASQMPSFENPSSKPPQIATSNPHQSADPIPSTDLPWDYSRNIEDVRALAEHWAETHMKFYEQETRAYPEVLRTLLISACGPELVRPLLESKKTRRFVVVRLLFGYLVDCLANTDIFMGFDTDTDRQVINANNTLNTPFSSVLVRKAALMDLAAVSALIRGSPRWHEFLQMLFMKHTFELWSIMEPLLPRDVNRSKANADLSIFVQESVKLAGRMVGDAPGYEWATVFHRAGVPFKGDEMVDRSAMIIGDPTTPQNRSLRVKLSVTPTIVCREYIGMSIVAKTVHRANVLLMG